MRGKQEESPPNAGPGPEPGAASDKQPFQVKDCALIAIATGRRAQNLRELRGILQTIDPGSIYYHFWGSRLQPRFDDPEYQNDFASWANRALRDGKAAERLGVIDPTEFQNLEELRQELIDVIEERLDESEQVLWARTDMQFNFLTSQIVVFDTHKVINEPEQLVTAVPSMSASSIFYHVIDARRRTIDSIDDFRSWLSGFGSGFGDTYRDLSEQIADLDPFFSTLPDLRDQLAALLTAYFGR